MRFIVFSLKSALLIAAQLVAFVAILIYGFAIIGVITDNPMVDQIKSTMYVLSAVWVVLAAIFVLRIQFIGGAHLDGFSRILATLVWAVTVIGGFYPIYYIEYVL